MKNLFLILSVFLIGCGQKHPAQLQFNGFESYVEEFNLEARIMKGRSVSDLIIKFGDINDMNEAGFCQTFDDATPVITIDQKTWESSWLTSDMKTAIIMHELGHCILGRAHRTDVTPTFHSRSFMYPVAISVGTDDNYFQANKEAYFQELFSEGDGPTQ